MKITVNVHLVTEHSRCISKPVMKEHTHCNNKQLIMKEHTKCNSKHLTKEHCKHVTRCKQPAWQSPMLPGGLDAETTSPLARHSTARLEPSSRYRSNVFLPTPEVGYGSNTLAE